MLGFADTWIFTWVIIPLLIFFARIMDVSIGTLRLILLSRGEKYIAPALGFVEVIIWLLAIRQILQHLDNAACYVAYGAGFATGNYIGMLLNERLSLGKVILRVFSRIKTEDTINHLRAGGFGLTVVDAQGMTGEVKMLFTILRKKELRTALDIIHSHDEQAFYTVEDVQTVREGYFRMGMNKSRVPIIGPFSIFRKGK